MEPPTTNLISDPPLQHTARFVVAAQPEASPQQCLQSLHDRPLASSALAAANQIHTVWGLPRWSTVGLLDWAELGPSRPHQGIPAQGPNHKTHTARGPRNNRHFEPRSQMRSWEWSHTIEAPTTHWAQPRFVELLVGAHQLMWSQHPRVLWVPHPDEDLVAESWGGEQALQLN